MSGYKVIHVQYAGGNVDTPTATVKIAKPNGSEVVEAATGTGPVDAIFKAIQRALEIPHVTLVDFSVFNTSAGSEAEGKTSVRIKEHVREYEGEGSNKDIVVASAYAFADALNKRAVEAVVAAHTV